MASRKGESVRKPNKSVVAPSVFSDKGIKIQIILIIIHCIHYQHSDWPSDPAYFENSRDFVDKNDFSIICYPILV